MLVLLKKRRFFLLAVFLLVLSLALLSWDVTSPRSASFIKGAVLTVLSVPLKVLSFISRETSSVVDKYIFLVNLKDENRSLREELQGLRHDNRLLQIEAKENERLRDVLLLKDRVPAKTVVAEILGEDPSGWYKTLVIDRGGTWGIRAGNGVISPQGAVGRILDVGENIAKILLIVDKNSSIDAMIERTHSRGILEGGGHRLCELKYVEIEEDVKPGDRVVCSGLGRVFPEGCPIGTVTRVIKRGGALFQSIEVSPCVNFSRIEEVLVTIN
jgi:rod shape-determining protein MreC